MKKSEMNDIQKVNYEYMLTFGMKKSWAKRLVGEGSWYAGEVVEDKDEVADFVRDFARWDSTPEGRNFWIDVEKDAPSILESMSYHQALLEIPNKLVKKSE